MSRLNYSEESPIEEHNDGFEELGEERREIVVIIDGDFLTYNAAYSGKDESGNRNPDYTEEQYPEVAVKLSEMFMKIVNTIQDRYDIKAVYLCLKGAGNFRKSIFEGYKSQRPPTPAIIPYLHKHLIEQHQGIEAVGFEADDLVFSISQTIEHQGLIVAVDKDLKQIPSLFWNPMKNIWYKVTEEEARYNLALQMITNDATDGVNFTKGWGIAKAKKLINPKMSNFQYMKAILPIYQKLHGEKAKEVMKLAYNLLKLHTVDFNKITKN